jgi:hypothetical protein
MKELSADQIAAALAGRPGDSWREVRLLMLFLSEPEDGIEVDPESLRDAPRKAA